MAMSLRDIILSQVASGIQRTSVKTASRYASTYRVMGKPFPGPVRFDRHPWSVEMHDTDASWVGPKAAQMGYTETCLDRSFYTIDVLKSDVLYLLPKKNPDATDFSKARFDAALELSRHLRELFSNTRNVGHKQAGATNFYLRGTRSKSGVKSLPVALLILDELDEMVQANLPQAEERLSGQVDKQIIKISTPTVPDFGIDLAYQGTTQEQFVFKCPMCGRRIFLNFDADLVVTTDNPNDQAALERSHIVCGSCRKPLNHAAKVDWLRHAKWEPQGDPKAAVRGFHINQMYSTTVAPWEIAKKKLLSLTRPEEEQEYWNSKGGKAHVVAGARISDSMLNECLGNYRLNDFAPPGKIRTLGVDVGYKWLHYEIDEWFIPSNPGADLNVNSIPKVIRAGKVETFPEIHALMREYQIEGAVIDANPENRKAFEFAVKFEGYVWLCYYTRGNSKNAIKVNEAEHTISVGRTSWLDLSLGRFKRGRKGIVLPNDISHEYREHIKASIRKPGRDADGNPTAVYINVGADHHGHSRNYAEIALTLAVSRMTNTDVAALL